VDSQHSDDVKGQGDDLDDSLEGQNGMTEDVVKKSCQWPQLQRLIFKYNNLEKIDESLVGECTKSKNFNIFFI